MSFSTAQREDIGVLGAFWSVQRANVRVNISARLEQYAQCAKIILERELINNYSAKNRVYVTCYAAVGLRRVVCWGSTARAVRVNY